MRLGHRRSTLLLYELQLDAQVAVDDGGRSRNKTEQLSQVRRERLRLDDAPEELHVGRNVLEVDSPARALLVLIFAPVVSLVLVLVLALLLVLLLILGS